MSCTAGWADSAPPSTRLVTTPPGPAATELGEEEAKYPPPPTAPLPEPIRSCDCCCCWGVSNFLSGGFGLDDVLPSRGLEAMGKGVLITGRMTLVTTVDATRMDPRLPAAGFEPSDMAPVPVEPESSGWLARGGKEAA